MHAQRPALLLRRRAQLRLMTLVAPRPPPPQVQQLDDVAEASVEQGRLEERQRTQALVAQLQEERRHVSRADALRRAIVTGEARDVRDVSSALRQWYVAAFARGWAPAIDEAKRLLGSDREAGKLVKQLAAAGRELKEERTAHQQTLGRHV